jgi:sulfate transport system ATP-binding protein
VRPHDLEVSLSDSSEGAGPEAVNAIVKFISSAGAVVRVELQREDNGGGLEAEVTRQRYHELDLKTGQKVRVTARNLRVFHGG